MLASVAGVRRDPALAAWFSGAATGASIDTAAASDVIGTIATRLFGGPVDDDVRGRARWVVRVTLSLLAMPGRDDADERAQLERFVAPVVVGPGAAPGQDRVHAAAP